MSLYDQEEEKPTKWSQDPTYIPTKNNVKSYRIILS